MRRSRPSGAASNNRRGAAAPGTVALVLATSTGGVGVHVRSLATTLIEAGWTVTVCAPTSTLDVFDFAALGARVERIRLGGPGTEARATAGLRRACADADVVHAHGLRAGLAAVLSRRRPLVVTWHNAVLARGVRARVLARGERAVARGASVSLGASDDLVTRIAELGARDVRLAPVAAPRPVPARDRAAVRAGLGLAERLQTPLIVCVGRLHPQKAIDVLVRAAADWRDLDPAPVVMVAGDGPEQQRLQGLIDALDAPVRLLGRRRDVADLLAAADLVMLPSRWEARPLAVQEAMALGRAVVATDVGGVRDLVGDAAELIPPDDVGALSGRVRDLLADPARRDRLGNLAVARARTWPDERAANQFVIGVYEQLRARGG